MSFIIQLIGGFLIFTGAPLLVAGSVHFAQSISDDSQRVGAIGALALLSVWSGTGFLLIRAGKRSERRKVEKKLLATFFSLLRQNQGRITPLAFAAESGLNGAEARKFLDARSQEFNGSFDVDLDGGVVYRFAVSELPPTRAESPDGR